MFYTVQAVSDEVGSSRPSVHFNPLIVVSSRLNRKWTSEDYPRPDRSHWDWLYHHHDCSRLDSLQHYLPFELILEHSCGFKRLILFKVINVNSTTHRCNTGVSRDLFWVSCHSRCLQHDSVTSYRRSSSNFISTPTTHRSTLLRTKTAAKW